MTADSNAQSSAASSMVRQALISAGIPFVLGVTLGVLVHRYETVAATQPSTRDAQPPAARPVTGMPATPEHLKLVAEKQAEPLLKQLTSTPNDPALLAKIGNVYYVSKNYEEACTYFRRSLEIRDDATLRTELGRAYFYAGDADEALAQFEKVLKKDPDNANAMFNLGMVKWQSKFDVEGALAAWEQLLKKNPNHPRRAEVEGLIARAKQHRAMKPPATAGEPPL